MKAIEVNEDNRKWLKETFMFHGKSVYKWNRDKNEKEFINAMWSLVRDCMKYSYSKGYRTGHIKGFARGLQWKQTAKDRRETTQ